MSAPKALAVTSYGSEPALVTPVLAALEAVGLKLRAVDMGRATGDGSGAMDWILRTLGGELVERTLRKELESHRPDVVLCFEPGAAAVLCELRETAARPFLVIALASDVSVSAAWSQSSCDRYLVASEESAAALEDHGVLGHSILSVGAVGELGFVLAGRASKARLKSSFSIEGRGVLVDASGFDAELASQVALQLSLLGGDISVLFDVGSNSEVAMALRSQVPLLDMKAKLFGETEERALLWRSVDVIISRATAQAASRSSLVGAALVCLTPGEGAESRRAVALEERQVGALAGSALTLGTAVERALAFLATDYAGQDGAANIADIAYVLGQDRDAIIAESEREARTRRQSGVKEASEFADWANKAQAVPSGLEDLSGPSRAPETPDLAKLARLREEIVQRKGQLEKQLADTQTQIRHWERQEAQGKKLANGSMQKEGSRNADMERMRMHKALAELSGLAKEEQSLMSAERLAKDAPKVQKPSSTSQAAKGRTEQAPRPKTKRSSSVDEELERLRRSSGKAPKARAKKKRRKAKADKEQTVDDELAALKSKMQKSKSK